MSLKHWLEYDTSEKFLKGLRLVSPPNMPSELQYLITGGARVEIWQKKVKMMSLESGSQVALNGNDLAAKHVLVDCILGFLESPAQVEFILGNNRNLKNSERRDFCSILGRSPLLVGETLQDSLLFRTHEVCKHDLFKVSERFFGGSLKQQTKEQGNAIQTFSLSAKEHMEVATANLFLQKTPVVVFDLGSELMHAAIAGGYRLPEELIQSGKTIFWILPTKQELLSRGELQLDPLLWAEQRTGVRFTLALDIF